MAKESGIAMTAAVDDSGGTARQIENDLTNMDWATPRGVQDSTGINSSAMERILLLADMSITMNGPFNPASAPSSHDCFKTLSSSSVTRTITLVVSGDQTLPGEFIGTDYPLSRSTSGELTFSVPFLLNSTVVPTWA